MSNTNLSLLALATKYADELVPTINLAAATVRDVSKVAGGGPNVSWVAKTDGYTGASIGAYNEGATFSSYSADPQIALTLPWARFADAKFISGTALRAAQSTISPLGNRNLAVDKINDAIEVVCAGINDLILHGVGDTNNPTGMSTAYSDTGTYAGQDRHTPANLPIRGNVIDPGVPTQPTLALMRQDRSVIEKVSGRPPMKARVSFAQWDQLAGQFDQNRMFLTNLQSSGQPQNLVYSGSKLMIDDMEIVRDRQMLDTEIFYDSPRDVEIVFALPENFPEVQRMGLAGNDGLGPLGLPLMFKLLPEDADGHKFVVFIEYQLRVLRPNATGKRVNCKLTA